MDKVLEESFRPFSLNKEKDFSLRLLVYNFVIVRLITL